MNLKEENLEPSWHGALLSRMHGRGTRGVAPASDTGRGVRRGCPRVEPRLRFFFFLGFAPTRLDSRRCGSIRAESASIRAESG